ncbi:MAG: neutral zinc metallopeptidase [Bacteroidetes bacterium]|nr:neutral zinc metallopeptidase [Bacteroidota bacterium]MBK8415412.1 neutral zinc metallopeptidase [Bacteroidota bacterium]MBL0074264.1 neutral zinc metallopeptidase [Bacteroidota bacterium]
MKWRNREGSGNVEDRRGGGAKLGAGLGIGTVIIIIIALLTGSDPSQLLQQVGQQQQTEQPASGAALNDEASQFVSVVLKETEVVWEQVFREQLQATYEQPKLVLFTGEVQSACGFASAASGPFYCPADAKAYIDLSFYSELKERFKAPGDFAMAYVIAHEIGHHVQNQLGISDKVHGMRGQISEEEYNQLSVKVELQADFFAGLWAHHAHELNNILEAGDIEEALTAANAIGDDRLQMESRGYVVPESFTHGTSDQRMFWFKKGFQSGLMSDGDTFKRGVVN